MQLFQFGKDPESRFSSISRFPLHIVFAIVILGNIQAADPLDKPDLQSIVERLGSRVYAERDAARESLREALLLSQWNTTDTISKFAQTSDLEIRIAIEEVVSGLGRLQDPSRRLPDDASAGTKPFESLVEVVIGEGLASRMWLKRAVDRWPELARVHHDESLDAKLGEIVSSPEWKAMESSQTEQADRLIIKLLRHHLLMNGHPQALTTAMANRSFAAELIESGEAIADHPATPIESRLALRKALRAWLNLREPCLEIATRLQVALSQSLYEKSRVLIDTAFESNIDTPKDTITLMLAAYRLGVELPDGFRSQCLLDHRVAYRTRSRWQRGEFVITTVSDVAWALELIQRELDPREYGFIHLYGHRLFEFAPESTGFSCEASRQSSRKAL